MEKQCNKVHFYHSLGCTADAIIVIGIGQVATVSGKLELKMAKTVVNFQ